MELYNGYDGTEQQRYITVTRPYTYTTASWALQFAVIQRRVLKKLSIKNSPIFDPTVVN